MTKIERYILERMFNFANEGNSNYYFTIEGIEYCIDLCPVIFSQLISNDDSFVALCIKELLTNASFNEIVLPDNFYVLIFQEIIGRHSNEISYVTIQGANTCSRRIASAFGGYAEIITTGGWKKVRTSTWLAEEIDKIGSHGQMNLRELEIESF